MALQERREGVEGGVDGNAGRLFRAVAVSAPARSDDSGWEGMGRGVG